MKVTNGLGSLSLIDSNNKMQNKSLKVATKGLGRWTGQICSVYLHIQQTLHS